MSLFNEPLGSRVHLRRKTIDFDAAGGEAISAHVMRRESANDTLHFSSRGFLGLLGKSQRCQH